jgi:hypothetical protein
LLVGQTPSDAYKQEAGKIVGRIEGVRHVYNELRLGKPVSIGVRSNDTWITSKVRADMLGTKNFDSTKVKVVTENSEVFLIGLVTRQEGDQAVEIARHVSGVKQVIKAFEFAQNAASWLRFLFDDFQGRTTRRARWLRLGFYRRLGLLQPEIVARLRREQGSHAVFPGMNGQYGRHGNVDLL